MTRTEDREILTDIAYQWEKLAALRQHDLIDVADSIASKPHEYNQLNFPIDKPKRGSFTQKQCRGQPSSYGTDTKANYFSGGTPRG
jgi:hypothetical protein